MRFIFQFIIFFLISIISANTPFIRCGIHQELDNPNGFRSRPNMDTYAPSPSGKFYIHYDYQGQNAPDLVDENNNGFPDYIDEVGIAADYVDSMLVSVLNYLPVVTDDDQKYDIYVKDMGQGYYGVNYLDLDLEGNQTGSSYILIDNEYEEGEYYTFGIEAMKITVAHEYFHAIQRSYRLQFNSETLYLYEMSSTWIEDVIYPEINDYIDSGWLLSFYSNPIQNISDTDGYSIALYAHYLTSVIENKDNLESSIIRQIWEQFSIYNDAHYSLNLVLENNYSTMFMNTWLDFCMRNLYNGIYSNMNNDFYYYSDQINAIPIEINNFNNLDDLVNIEQALVDESVYINAFNLPDFDFFINIENWDENILGNIVVEPEIIDQNSHSYIIEAEDLSYHYLDDHKSRIYLFAGSDTQSVLNYTLSTHQFEFGDINQNNFINVVDIIYLVNYIFGSFDLNEFQLILSDLNTDNIISILDIVEIVNLIIQV